MSMRKSQGWCELSTDGHSAIIDERNSSGHNPVRSVREEYSEDSRMLVGLAIGILVLVVLMSVVWCVRDELQGVWNDSGRTLSEVLAGVVALMQMVWCWSYAIRWRLRFVFRNATGQTVWGVLIIGSFYIVLEMFIDLIREAYQTSIPGDGDRNLGSQQAIQEAILAGLDKLRAHIPKLPTMPMWVNILLSILAIVVLHHHLQGWKLSRREAQVPINLKRLIEKCRPLLGKTRLTAEESKKLFDAVMKNTVALLQTEQKKKRFRMSLLMMNSQGNQIHVIHRYPSGGDIECQVGTGRGLSLRSAAGRCFDLRAAVYVPSTRHLGGINLSDYRTIGLVYERTASGVTQCSNALMCVPVFRGALVAAVLSISSDRHNAFGPLDFSIADLAATLLTDSSF